MSTTKLQELAADNELKVEIATKVHELVQAIHYRSLDAENQATARHFIREWLARKGEVTGS